MEHITNNSVNSEEVISELKTTTGTAAKKKCKKAKDSNENINKTISNSNTLEIGEIIMDNLTLHTNNGLPNGVANDHDAETETSLDGDKENQLLVNNCERLDDNETETLADRIGTVNINESTQDNVTKCNDDVTTQSSGVTMTTRCPECDDDSCTSPDAISFESYKSELQMGEIMRLIQKDLSEPYSIYTYRYFIHNWPKLCFLAMHNKRCIGAIVCKLDLHRKVKRGYIAMLAVDEKYRKRKIGSHLVRQAITAMVADDADEVVLETEITNKPALRLYGNLGFVRDKRLFRYYLNGVDALRLKLWLR